MNHGPPVGPYAGRKGTMSEEQRKAIADMMMKQALAEGAERIDQVVKTLESAAAEIRRYREHYDRAARTPEAISNGSFTSAESAIGSIINHMAANVLVNARLDLLGDSMAKIAKAREMTVNWN